MDTENQCKAVLEYIFKNGSIDTRRATRELEIYRLSARIWDIEHRMGFPVIRTPRYKYDSHGKVEKRWVEYSL